MKTTIGKFDKASGTVPVTFEHNGVTHLRPVNACLAAAGKYDPDATAARVEDVARGVAVKIEAGVLTNPLPEDPAL